MNLYKYPMKNSENQLKTLARLNRGSFISEIHIKRFRYSLILIGVYDFKRELISRRINGEMIVETVSCPEIQFRGTSNGSYELRQSRKRPNGYVSLPALQSAHDKC